MKHSFQILSHRNDDRLHLKLVGTFDDDAADRLLNVLQAHGKKFSMVMVHTAGLDLPSPSGMGALRAGLEARGRTVFRLVFTGEHVPDSFAQRERDPDRNRTESATLAGGRQV